MDIQISLIGSSAIPLTVNLTTSGASATSGEDYVPLTLSPVRLVDQITNVTVYLVNDGIVDGEEIEQFQVTLSGPSELTDRVDIQQNSTAVYIQDDDGKLQLCSKIKTLVHRRMTDTVKKFTCS